MNEELIKNTDEWYRNAEQKAKLYFETLYNRVEKKTFIPLLAKDLQSWSRNHIHLRSIAYFLGRGRGIGKDEWGYHNYIHWLNYRGKLDPYLNRSVSYIFLRDLGKALDSPDTQMRIQHVVERLKGQLLNSSTTNNDGLFSTAGLYRKAQEENIEATMIWLFNKLTSVSTKIPTGMNVEHAQRKLIKIIAGVLMHVIEEMDEDISPIDRAQHLDKAIRLGYSYGLTYPFIDDLLDADVLSTSEKKRYSELIRSALVTGTVPELGEWSGDHDELIQYVHSELCEAFEYIKANQRPENMKAFFEQSYVFFHAQEVDRAKDVSYDNYSNEDLYIPVILKSSSSRLIVRSVIGASEDEKFENRTFYYGIYNQLADDFTDMFEDLENGAVTPYTYFLKYHGKRPDLLNPFELYWTVISYLIHDVYHSDAKTTEVILNRAINGMKRFKKRLGTQKYNEVMGLFAIENRKFNSVLQKLVRKADDVDFFDKLLRDHIIANLKNGRKEQKDFVDTFKNVGQQINSVLSMPTDKGGVLRDTIIEAANYSLEGDGKRMRPIIAWVMGVKGYGLEPSALIPLLKSLEYMHTASLIYDDLPSQDNASLRRGRPTLHEVYNVATAELSGLFLTQKALKDQTTLGKYFDAKAVLELIRYSAETTASICQGQSMDLESKGKVLTVEQLNTLCFYKTGIAFEASVIMPAILAGASKGEKETLKKFARHAGIAFQIKDDLLDFEGNSSTLGKPVGKDIDNNTSTFVTILGVEAAKKVMWDHYCSAIEALQEVPRNTSFLMQLMNYIVQRER